MKPLTYLRVVDARLVVLSAINNVRRFTHPDAFVGTRGVYNANIGCAAGNMDLVRSAWRYYRVAWRQHLAKNVKVAA